jgi:transposase
LTDAEQETLARVLQANPLLAHGYNLKTGFQTLMARRDQAAFDRWLQEAETSEIPSCHIVARSVRQDYAAIIAALTTPWSTGQCEGQICRVKLLNRGGDGRAKLDLLRQRILHRPRAPMTFAGNERQVQHRVAA